MSRIDTIGRHIFYKKRNEQPYLVEASAAPQSEQQMPQAAPSMLPLTPALVSAAGSTPSASTPAMSLGFAASE
jgi:hypothetical protein